MSRLDPLLEALRKTDADELRLIPGERIHVMRSGQRQDIGREPLPPAGVEAVIAEVGRPDEIAAARKAPKTMRVESAGFSYDAHVSGPADRLTLVLKPVAGQPRPRMPSGPRIDSSPPPAMAAVLPESRRGVAVAPAVPTTTTTTTSTTPRAAAPSANHGTHGSGSAIDELLGDMIRRRASDLHLSSGTSPVLRIDGEVHFCNDRPALGTDDVLALIRPIMTSKAEKDFEERNDADFGYEVQGLARFRANVFRDRNGVGAVLRQIPIEIVSAEKLGLPKAVTDLCFLSKGLVLVTGPTGSGKSTTLASMIDYINRHRSDHIITIEDPVEFVHKNVKCLVNQREVGNHTMSFKNALRAALREDPDIVLVGEMRDLETIAIAIETAETGHLVFGTLHTTTAVSTIDRIIDQFPTDQQAQIRVMLSESLKGVVAQVLCKKAGGGRAAALEVLIVNHAVSSLIREGKTFQIPSVMQTSKNIGMQTMNDSLMTLVQKKQISAQDAWVKAVDKSGLLAMFKQVGINVGPA